MWYDAIVSKIKEIKYKSKGSRNYSKSIDVNSVIGHKKRKCEKIKRYL